MAYGCRLLLLLGPCQFIGDDSCTPELVDEVRKMVEQKYSARK